VLDFSVDGAEPQRVRRVQVPREQLAGHRRAGGGSARGPAAGHPRDAGARRHAGRALRRAAGRLRGTQLPGPRRPRRHRLQGAGETQGRVRLESCQDIRIPIRSVKIHLKKSIIILSKLIM
jgi:hypothetical protein